MPENTTKNVKRKVINPLQPYYMDNFALFKMFTNKVTKI